MGKPSDRRRRIRRPRPGKRARARVKKPSRSQVWGSVSGAGTYELKAGRKKWDEFHNSRRNPFGRWALSVRKLAYGETIDQGADPAYPS